MAALKNYILENGLEATKQKLLEVIAEEQRETPLEARPLRILELKTLDPQTWDNLLFAVQSAGFRELHQELLFTRLELKKAGF